MIFIYIAYINVLFTSCFILYSNSNFLILSKCIQSHWTHIINWWYWKLSSYKLVNLIFNSWELIWALLKGQNLNFTLRMTIGSLYIQYYQFLYFASIWTFCRSGKAMKKEFSDEKSVLRFGTRGEKSKIDYIPGIIVSWPTTMLKQVNLGSRIWRILNSWIEARRVSTVEMS